MGRATPTPTPTPPTGSAPEHHWLGREGHGQGTGTATRDPQAHTVGRCEEQVGDGPAWTSELPSHL